MSRAQYQRHAEQVLAETAGEEARWALVLAKQPWTPNSLARILGEVERGATGSALVLCMLPEWGCKQNRFQSPRRGTLGKTFSPMLH